MSWAGVVEQIETRLTLYVIAAVYLKNRISRGWVTDDSSALYKPIPENERAPFRDRVVPVLASSPPPIRAQLIPVLQTILQSDFPLKWPNFMDITLQLLNGADASSVYAGLQCLLSICRTYRFKSGDSRADLDKIVEGAFPALLLLANRLIAEESNDAGEMMRLAVKCYKHAIYVGRIGFQHNHLLMLFSSMSFQFRYGLSKPLLIGAHSSSK